MTDMAKYSNEAILEVARLATQISAMHRAIDAGVKDGTLDCVVAGQTKHDGTLAPLCRDIISRPEAMCAACRIRTTRGSDV